MSSLQTILEAVFTLSNIQEADREGLLLEHREELKTALNSLHSLLQIPCASISESDSTFGGSTQLEGTSDNQNASPPTASPPAASLSVASPAPPPTTSPSATSPASPAASPSAASPSAASPASPSAASPSAASPASPAASPSAASPAPPPTTSPSAASPASPPAASPSATSPSAASPASPATSPSAASPAPPPTTSPSAASPASPATSPSAAPVHSVDPVSTETPATIKALFKALRKRETEIREYMQDNIGRVNQSGSDWSAEDPRIVDISQIDSSDKTNPCSNLRSGFSALSLADEYTEWEKAEGLESRIDKLCKNLKSGNRGSRYKNFVDNRDFKNHEKARKYVRYGMQLRVFMRLYSPHFKGNTEALGMAGIMSFCFWNFTRISFPDMELLVPLLVSSRWHGYAIDKDSWMSSRFEAHKVRLNLLKKRLMQEPEPVGRKRQRLEPNCSNDMLPGSNLPIQDVNPLGHPHVTDPQDNTLLTFIPDVNPLGYPHVINHLDNTPLTFIPDVNPLGYPHVTDPQDNTLLTFIPDVNPLGYPHLNEPSHSSSPSPLPSEHIPVAVQDVIAGIPNTL